MKVTNSPFGIDTKEVAVNGAYCGLCSANSLPMLQAFERSLRGSPRLREAAAAVMSRSGQRPLGGFAGETELLAWLDRHGSFAGHLWYDAGPGMLWSPVAWSVAMRVAKTKGRN